MASEDNAVLQCHTHSHTHTHTHTQLHIHVEVLLQYRYLILLWPIAQWVLGARDILKITIAIIRINQHASTTNILRQ